MKDIEIKNEFGKFKFRVSAVIIIDNHILLEKAKKYDGYCFPGGHVELGETSVEALKRELKEELNIKSKKANLLCVQENIYKNKDGSPIQEINYFYKVNTNATFSENPLKITELDKSEEKNHIFEWVNLECLKDLCIQPLSVRDILINKSKKKVLLTDYR